MGSNHLQRLVEENQSLAARVRELEETLEAIRSGEVDALVVKTDAGEQIFSLSSAETSYRFLIEQMNEGAAILSEEGTVIYCNRQCAEMLRTPIEQVIGRTLYDLLPEELESRIRDLVEGGLRKHVQQDFPVFSGHSQNEEPLEDVHYLFSMAPFVNKLPREFEQGKNEESRFVSLTFTDISVLKNLEQRLLESRSSLEKKVAWRTEALQRANLELEASRREAIARMEEARDVSRQLEKSEARLKEAQKLGRIGSWEYDLAGDTYIWSDEMYRLHGLEPGSEPVRFQEDPGYYPSEQAGILKSHAKRVLESGENAEFDFNATTAGGREVVFSTVMKPIFDQNDQITGIHGTLQDVTERNQARERIERELAQKKVLLRELYHRTKNNMQVISSMLRLRARVENNQAVTTAFREIENRIIGMALAHQKLYESKDLSHLNLRDYLESLIDSVKGFQADHLDHVSIRTQMTDIPILIDTAIPIGLVVNELLTNAFKYAFPDRQQGTIDVRLFLEKENVTVLEIGDNGTGFPEGFGPRTHGNLGLQTVYDLVEKQLDGRISLTNENGVCFRLEFKREIYEERV